MIDHCWRRIKGFCHGNTSDVSEPLLDSFSDTVSLDLDEDVDVKAEHDRVLSGAADKAIIYLRNLRKVELSILLSFSFFFLDVLF